MPSIFWCIHQRLRAFKMTPVWQTAPLLNVRLMEWGILSPERQTFPGQCLVFLKLNICALKLFPGYIIGP